jgi:hypothetical protein
VTYGARAVTCDVSCWPLVCCGSVWPPAWQQIAKSKSTECRIMVHAHSHKFTCCCSPCTRRGPFDLREELERRAHSLLLPDTLIAAHLCALTVRVGARAPSYITRSHTWICSHVLFIIVIPLRLSLSFQVYLHLYYI